MVIFRDPRPMAVSVYFFMLRRWRDPDTHSTIDEYVQRMFPIFCQWLTIRYVLFMEMMSGSVVFWYSEALKEPVAWFRTWFHSIGLQLPEMFVNDIAFAAVHGGEGMLRRVRDSHPGGAAISPNRSYTDELEAETLASFESHMVTWLPPEIVERLDILLL